MRKIAVTIAVLVAMLCIVHPIQAHAGSFEELDDGIYAYIGLDDTSPKGSFGANAGIVIGDNGILVVDTLVSAKAAAKFLEDIRRVSDKPILYVVNTHGHLDHAFGNSVFGKEGAVIVSHADCKAYIESTGEATLKNIEGYGLTAEDIVGTEIVLPAITFTGRMSIDLGGKTVELINTGHSHTDGSLLVLVPEARTVFAGDVLFTDSHPFLGEGDIPVWLEALDVLDDIDAKKIVPGHGPLSGSKDIEDMKAYLVVFDKVATALAAKSDDVDYIVAEVLKSVPKRSHGEFLVKGNIQMKYLKKD